jgi:hypothetical protein
MDDCPRCRPPQRCFVCDTIFELKRRSFPMPLIVTQFSGIFSAVEQLWPAAAGIAALFEKHAAGTITPDEAAKVTAIHAAVTAAPVA